MVDLVVAGVAVLIAIMTAVGNLLNMFGNDNMQRSKKVSKILKISKDKK